jgi:hypothetical protein
MIINEHARQSIDMIQESMYNSSHRNAKELIMTKYTKDELLDTIIQHDDSVWRIIGVGVESDLGVVCHLASVHAFNIQKNGKVPYQICDIIPFKALYLRRTN